MSYDGGPLSVGARACVNRGLLRPDTATMTALPSDSADLGVLRPVAQLVEQLGGARLLEQVRGPISP